MEIREWITLMSIFLPILLALYGLGVKGISAWKEIEKTRSTERIEAIVDLRFNNKLDEMKKNYNEMISLLKGGTFK